MLLYMGLNKEQYHEVKELIAKDNRRSIAAWSICTALFWIMSLLMSLESDAYAACRIVYIAALGMSIITLIGARFFVKRAPWSVTPMISLFLFSILGAGIGIAICQPDVRTASMIAFAVIVPTCVINNIITNIIIHGLTIVAYVILAKNVIEPGIYSWGLTNLIIFSVAGILAGHVINKQRSERFVYAESAKKLADIQTRYAYYDQLTGLKNRRAYVEKLKQIENEWPDDFCVIMVDLNGLKKTNDTLGHEVGDELIVGASECLSTVFKKTDLIYRIGGDEFCIILIDTPEEAMRCLKELERVTANWKGRSINGISISYGVATNQNQSDINSIIIQADQKMYEHKRNYYMNSAFDRRRR